MRILALAIVLFQLRAFGTPIDVYREFCPQIAPPHRYDKNPILDTEYLRKTLPGREVWFVKGLGGDIHTPDPQLNWPETATKSALAVAERVALHEDYMNMTSRQAVVSLGGRARVLSTRTARPTDDSARDILCPAVHDFIRSQLRLPVKDQKKLVLIGHSKGGRALLAMSKLCPEVLNSPLVESVTTVGSPIGASALADAVKATENKTCIEDSIYDNETRSPDERRRDLELFSLIRKVSHPDLAQPYSLSHLQTSDMRNAISKKLGFIALTWEKSCDEKFWKVVDGLNQET